MVYFFKKIKTHMSQLTQLPHKLKSLNIKRAVGVSSIVVTLSIGTVYAANKLDTDVETVYHLYYKDELLGTVSSKNVIEDILKEEVNKASSTYQEYEFSIEDQITYIPEKMYSPSYDNQEAIKKLKEQYSVLATAVGITIDGKTVAYVANEQDAENVIEQIKLKYVPEEVLKKLEKNASEEVEYDDYIYKDVYIEENISFAEGETFPKDILSVEQVVELLMKGTLQPKIHEVQEGEVLGQIANDYGLTLKQLLELNPDVDEEKIIHIGDQLNVTAYEPLVSVVVEMEAVRNETIPFEIEVIEDENVFKGTTKVKQEGINGEKVVRYSITRKNGQLASKVVMEEEVLKEPTEKIIIKGTKVIPSRGTGEFSWPTVGGYISSEMGYRWGRLHKGIDIARPSDRSILAADNGTVEFAGWQGNYGNKIVINHNNGMKTVYAHLSTINVQVGQVVSKGQKIGVMGSTGDSTGVHLHFEVYKNGTLINPRSVLF